MMMMAIIDNDASFVQVRERTESRLWALTSDPSPSTLPGWKYPADGQRSHPSALVRAFRRPRQRPTHGAGVIMSQDSTSKCDWRLDHPPTRVEIKKATLQLKEGKSDSSNYRGITLLSTAGKFLARALLNRLIPTITQENTPENSVSLCPTEKPQP